MTVFFVALFVAWEADGEIPDCDAPLPAENTKIFQAMQSQQRLYTRNLRTFTLDQDPTTDPDKLPTDEPMDRSYRRHYANIVQFSAAIRIMCTHKISPAEVKRSNKALRRTVQEWARLKCHLTPYFHLCAAHLEAQFLRYGPSPGFGAYPYERNNLTLASVNHNGRAGGELECTMMRGWWKMTFIHDLVCT